MLNRGFYIRDADTIAKDLLGKLLVHRTDKGIVSGMIVEVEAYMGAEDAASHAYRNLRTSRTEVMYSQGGYAYVYLIYGMYNCLNIVANAVDRPEAVLIRALQPVEGIELMKANRKAGEKSKLSSLCSGPGKLCMAMGIDRSQNGADLTRDTLCIENYMRVEKEEIASSPRINIDYAGKARDYLLRHFLKDNLYLSKKG